ncbi:TetR/AcrR family transcriptional regulator [Amycolatopsis jiangsuensis]|uniref:AcrR family transcriptional regulator n=1 Tax=Amycolatopsis jiangsuensis TaxID=1181879 RepID=A0A840ITI4_9PSEU|nr:TetR/AcrR family transcriptional regulator C-terminal domain-containing protein [Amycolatopsis jiangsuensis]MBB4684532.1 AcrR family transcriptional regulator [Amycolatopsis jiangsuensis]
MTATRKGRRSAALSRERIVEAAVELLDSGGESALTFRVLTERLATGPGAIYWHVANKDELLAVATDGVVADALAVGSEQSPAGPEDELRAVALGLYEAIAAHPWLGGQLSRQFTRNGPVVPRIYESIGRRVRALGVPEATWFVTTSVLVHYVLGAAGQNAANSASARTSADGANRADFLDAVSTAWEELDPDEYSFARAIAGQMRDHDDREQFLAGIDLVLAGLRLS